MLSQNQHPKELLAQGNLESALETLVRLTQHADDADLRQRVLTLSGQFAALKKQHLTGLLEEKDYRLQLNRITAAVAEIVDRDTVGVTLSHPDSKQQTWKKWAAILCILATLAATTAITLKYLFANPSSGHPTSLTVFAYDAKKGKQYPILQTEGHIWLDLNGERKQEAIDDKGKAVFQNLHIGDKVLLDVEFSEPYHAVQPDSMYVLPANGQIYLAVELKNLERIRGHIFYKEKPLADVVVSVENLRDTTDELGFYELSIPPELQRREQKLLLYHPKIGTQTETVYPQTDQDWDFVLKK